MDPVGIIITGANLASAVLNFVYAAIPLVVSLLP